MILLQQPKRRRFVSALTFCNSRRNGELHFMLKRCQNCRVHCVRPKHNLSCVSTHVDDAGSFHRKAPKSPEERKKCQRPLQKPKIESFNNAPECVVLHVCKRGYVLVTLHCYYLLSQGDGDK